VLGRCVLSLLLILFIIGCSSEKETHELEQAETQAIEVNGTVTETLVRNLYIPWTIEKYDNLIFLSERGGSIIQIDIETGLKKPLPLFLTEDIHHEGEGGLLGFVLSPDYETTGHAFGYHTYIKDNTIFNRVILLQKTDDKWEEKRVLLDEIPGGRIHNGGRIKIGPDGMLYVTAGDAGIPELAQDKSSLAGKILRMDLDGSIPENNPIPGSYIYSFGHRNPQGLAWDDNENLYSTEHGQSAHDEINLIKPGGNYGWPSIQGGQSAEGMIQPVYHTGEITWAPSGLDYYNGKLYIATLRDSKIRSYDLANKGIAIVHEGSGRMRDVFIEDQNLYTITNNHDGRGNPSKEDDLLIRIRLLKN